jgi:phage protein U
MIQMMLGALLFALDTLAYQKFQRQSTFRWPKQNLVGRLPTSQYTGPGRDTISLSGVIYPHYRGSLAALDALALQADDPLPLVDGLGIWYGYWVVDRISSDRSIFSFCGSPRKVEFTISISRFGEKKE